MSSGLSELIKKGKAESAFFADDKGVLEEEYKMGKGAQTAAVAAYLIHCMKTIESDLGMTDLKQIRISGKSKNLLLGFDGNRIVGLEGGKELTENSLDSYYEG